MKYWNSLAAAALCGFAGAAAAQAADVPMFLVSPDEVRLYRGSEGFDSPESEFRPRGAAVPAIEVVQPLSAAVKAPFPIVVKFRSGDAPIDASSFRVLYGALKLDITDRITKFAKPTVEGISFDKAQVPPGKHRLLLRVEDEKKRVAERELRVEVE